MDRELKQLQREHMKKLTQLQHEMEIVKQKAELEKYRREIYDSQKPAPQPPPPQPMPPQPHQVRNRSSDFITELKLSQLNR